ncbi:MAG: hypothetical protein C4547_13855 [Phycisphaerales bacterium]|nr:MAG: hypothetical protein C4547_13855 [Phycisphaerales bacterium]
MNVKGVTGSLIAAAVALCSLSCHPGARHGGVSYRHVRALWVTRWDFRSPRDIAAIMERCRQSGFNTVLFQVRGNGTVTYPSRYEPWAEEFDGRDPGFDPLATACAEAHRRGLALHAWVNVIPGWRGKTAPTDPRQLYNAHPDWFWHDEYGRRQPFGWYNSLNPCLPEVRQYLVAVMHEIVRRYPVDGLHLDYIRFPNEWHAMYESLGRVPDYPRDRRTLAMFTRQTGAAHPELDPARWDAWRAAQVTQLVAQIRGMMRDTRPGAQLSAAVGAFPDEAMRKHYQDSARWVRERLVDAVYPMNYSSNMPTFERCLDTWRGIARGVAVVPGVMFDKRDADLVSAQVSRAVDAHGGFAAFAYNSLFERTDETGRPKLDDQSADRAALRRSVLPRIRQLASGDRRGTTLVRMP